MLFFYSRLSLSCFILWLIKLAGGAYQIISTLLYSFHIYFLGLWAYCYGISSPLLVSLQESECNEMDGSLFEVWHLPGLPHFIFDMCINHLHRANVCSKGNKTVFPEMHWSCLQNCIPWNALELLPSSAGPLCNNLNLDQFTNSLKVIVSFLVNLCLNSPGSIIKNCSVSLYILSNSSKWTWLSGLLNIQFYVEYSN